MNKFVCTTCNKEIEKEYLKESIYRINPVTAGYYKLVMGSYPEGISKFKILHHEINEKTCGPVKRIQKTKCPVCLNERELIHISFDGSSIISCPLCEKK